MLTHYGNFFCSLGGKDLFKTGFSLCEAAFWERSLYLLMTFFSFSMEFDVEMLPIGRTAMAGIELLERSAETGDFIEAAHGGSLFDRIPLRKKRSAIGDASLDDVALNI